MRLYVESTQMSAADIHEKTRGIYAQMLEESRWLRQGNFEEIHDDDVRRMFKLYEEQFFAGRLRKQLGETPLDFRVSMRMTSAGGKTTRHVRRSSAGKSERYDIAVSGTLLFQTFHDVDRPIKVTGLVCRDRLEAMQRVMEHEIIHLAEMLLYTKSSCSDERFQSIARRFFGHTDHRHALVTQRERAAEKFNIKQGDRVHFIHEGHARVGIVNRITQRATVLVEDANGVRYTNGKHYAKFYVPLTMLKPAGD